MIIEKYQQKRQCGRSNYHTQSSLT